MVDKVINEVKSRPRELGYRKVEQNIQASVPWIMTYGSGYTETKEKVKELNQMLSGSRTWCDEDSEKIPHFQVVTRRAPNLKDTLFKRRAIALGSDSSETKPCTEPGVVRRGPKCQTCLLISRTSTVTNNGVTVSTRGGDCKSRNLIYAATCKLCTTNNVYVGKTVTTLGQRASEQILLHPKGL